MGHLAQSKIPFIYNFSQVALLHLIYLSLTLAFRLLSRNHLIGEIPLLFPASEHMSLIPPHPRTFYQNLIAAHSWFLDNPELGWSPPQTLVDWMAKARADGKPIVYIGFGSITVPNPKLVTERIIRGVLKSMSGILFFDS
jgi:hypothetical protein